MTAAEPRRGGLEVWAPSVTPPIGVELSDQQAMAIAFRHLASIGFAENLAGHITWQPKGRTDMYVNPWGLWWQEVSAGDICVLDEDAHVVQGKWDVTPAIHIHTTRTTSACWQPSADYPNWSIRPDRCSWTTCVWSTNTTVRSIPLHAQPNWPPGSVRPT